MSSKRGRKRNDNLPPNRARDVQRAFRARRAAHLQALEQRVSDLEEENGCLRQALHLPPSTRPSLGKGPTGKDKPKVFDVCNAQSLGFRSSRDSSVDSTPSRVGSQSPSGMTVSMSPRPMTVIEPNSWTESMLLNTHPQQQQPSEVVGSSDHSYQMAPMSAPLPLKPLQYSPYNALPPSRPLSSGVYITSPTHYSHSSDRPISSNYGNQGYVLRTEIREEPRQQYSYTHPHSFSTHDPNMHSDNPPLNMQPQSHPLDTQQNTHTQQPQFKCESPLPYPHRRSLTDPRGFSIGQGFPHLPNPAQLHDQHHSRQADYPRQQDIIQSSIMARPSSAYGPDSRLNPTA